MTVWSPPRSLISLRVSRICVGSRPTVGSSRISTAGLCSSASAEPDALAVALGQVADDRGCGPCPASTARRRNRSARRRSARSILRSRPRKSRYSLDLHFRVERAVLRQIAEVLADLLRLVEDVEAVHRRRAAGRRQVAGEHPQGRGLPRPVGPEEADDLAPRDLEADVVDGHHGAVGLGELRDRYHVDPPLDPSRVARIRPASVRQSAGRCERGSHPASNGQAVNPPGPQTRTRVESPPTFAARPR